MFVLRVDGGPIDKVSIPLIQIEWFLALWYEDHVNFGNCANLREVRTFYFEEPTGVIRKGHYGIH